MLATKTERMHLINIITRAATNGIDDEKVRKFLEEQRTRVEELKKKN